ncbi:NUDIX hydrolase [Modestobacter lacusdianchii]
MPAPSPTSLIDVVDESNEPIGAVPRGEVFERRVNFRTVHVLVFNASGELLLQQLSSSRRHPLQWGSSVAGYLHAGESYQHAAVRRLHEELQLSAPVSSLGVLSMTDEGLTKFVGVFTAQSDTPKIGEPDHIASLAFRPPAQIREDVDSHPELFTETLREVLAFWEKVDGGTRRRG